jgi:hypothetical protein
MPVESGWQKQSPPGPQESLPLHTVGLEQVPGRGWQVPDWQEVPGAHYGEVVSVVFVIIFGVGRIGGR